MIEGILNNPSGKLEENNFRVVVLVPGGPFKSANINNFLGNRYNWGSLCATEGWLVFQPNDRGSTVEVMNLLMKFDINH